MQALAVSSNLFAQVPRRKTLELVKKLGFGFVDLWSAPIIASHIDPQADTPEEVKAELDALGLSPLALSIYLTTVEEKVERLRWAARLGAPYAVFEPAPSRGFLEKMSNFPAQGRTLTPPGAGWHEFTKTLVHFLDIAQDLGLRVALEVPHVYTLIETPAGLECLLNDVQHPALFFTVAPPHVIARGSQLEDYIRLCGERLAILYLWNLTPGYRVGVDDRAFGVPAETLALKAYIDFRPWIAWAEEREGVTLSVTCRGTENWTNPDDIVQVIRESTAGLFRPPG